MAKLSVLLTVIAIVVAAILGGALYLAYGNFSPRTQPVAKVLPDARFPK